MLIALCVIAIIILMSNIARGEMATNQGERVSIGQGYMVHLNSDGSVKDMYKISDQPDYRSWIDAVRSVGLIGLGVMNFTRDDVMGTATGLILIAVAFTYEF